MAKDNVWKQKASQTDVAFYFSSLLSALVSPDRRRDVVLEYENGDGRTFTIGGVWHTLREVLHSRRGTFISSANTVEEFNSACQLIESSQKVDSKYHPVLLFVLTSASNTEPGILISEPGPEFPPIKLLWALGHETSNEFRVRSYIELLMHEPGALGLNLYTTVDVEFANQRPRVATTRQEAERWLRVHGLPNLENQIKQLSAEQEAAYNNRQRLKKLTLDARRFLEKPAH